jgi:hypothetical protein
VRLTTAFNRILRLPGAGVQTVAFTDCGVVISLRRRRRTLVCPCSATSRARYDTSRRRWRHLDFGACQVWLEADIHRIDCRAGGRVRTEQVWTSEVVESVYRAEAHESPHTPGYPNAETGDACASPSAPAANALTSSTGRSSDCCDGTATGSGAPGN